ncbi:MAG: glycosyltransferase family 2 protein [Polyangiaceae bacterium]
MASLLPISVVLPTYNRRKRLERVLAGLDRQTASVDLFQVIVVDDGSSDDTQEWLSKDRPRAYEVRVVRQQNGGPAKARNAGVAAADGELIVFLDDDVEPMPELLTEHLRSQRAELNVVVMGPMASLPRYAQPWVAWEQAKLEKQYAEIARGDWKPTFRQFWTGNASVAREHVLAAGGFDSSFLRAEDIELGRRLHERGLRFRFNPKARGLHHAERSLAAWEAMHKSYGALEVQIFGGSESPDLHNILAENLSRLHPASRWLVGSCVGRPRTVAAVRRSLRSLLEVEEKLNAPLASDQVCGALANLIYWQATCEALGRDAFERLLRLSDELRGHKTRG